MDRDRDKCWLHGRGAEVILSVSLGRGVTVTATATGNAVVGAEVEEKASDDDDTAGQPTEPTAEDDLCLLDVLGGNANRLWAPSEARGFFCEL